MLNATTRTDLVRNISDFPNQKPVAAGRNQSERSDHDSPGGEGSFLGIYARTPASHERRGFQPIDLIEEIDRETGEITYLQPTKKGHKVYKNPQQSRAERFALKSVVNRIFPTSPTSRCSRWRVPNNKVRVMKNDEFQKAHYTGLVRCASVWLCPLCAAKIAERRRSELVAAIASAQMMGWQVFMMTCTVPHGIGDDVHQIKENMLKAWRKMTDCRAGKEIKKLLEVEGTIRAFEVTYGENGFHPHFHVLIFTSGNAYASTFQSAFYPLWLDACIKSGLPAPSEAHGLRVDDGSQAAKYASKWGLEDEMTKGHTKTAQGDKGMTPWDFLRDVLKTASKRSEGLFRVYADCFKGSRQLYWSNGLKAKLAIAETTDEELVALEEETAYELAELTTEQWRAVLVTRSEAALLDLAERSPADIPSFLQSLQKIEVSK